MADEFAAAPSGARTGELSVPPIERPTNIRAAAILSALSDVQGRGQNGRGTLPIESNS